MPGRFVLVLTIALLTVFASACGGDEAAPACVDTLCQPTTSVCLGNSLATCGLDGKSWTVSPCSDGKCNSNTNSCELYKCKPLSQICGTDGTSYDRCPESGSGLQPGTCATNTTCVGGACVCEGKPAPFGSKKGKLHYTPTNQTGERGVEGDVSFGNSCAAAPRTVLLEQQNP